MKLLISILLSLFVVQANAATAYMISCKPGTSITGRLIYIGTYRYGNQLIERNFPSYCPLKIEIF